MANPLCTSILTGRDLDILLALDHGPMTAQQILRISQTFPRPFPDEKRVRERMNVLHDAGQVRRFAYATTGRGSLHYFTLSPLGYKLLYGPDAEAPSRRYFDTVAVARQHHTRCLADFIVHTIVAAYFAGIEFTSFYRENTLRLEVGAESIYPDCAFLLRTRDERDFGFIVELDNGTERVRSPKDADCWDRKIRLYETLQDCSPKRFRVLVVATARRDRLDHILATAAALAPNPKRRLFYGIQLDRFLQVPDALRLPCFTDHWGHDVALIQPDRTAPAPEQRIAEPLDTPAILGRSPRKPSLC
jgi:hypothetical protein